MTPRLAMLLTLSVLVVGGCEIRPRPFAAAGGQDRCRYQGSTYSHGSTACQSGTQYRCDDGEWEGWGTACPENPQVADKSCDRNGHSYSPGSTICQSDTQYRCDDGAWRSLALACVDADDVQARGGPAGRTCIYRGATVSTQSTICKSGITFLCEDGEWRNLGSACR